MADMYGAVRSNWFKVKDPAAFKTWLEENVRFGCDINIWLDGKDGAMALGGYEMYPSAYPHTTPSKEEDEDDAESNPWDLEHFATHVRHHLLPGEEFRVFAAGNEKLRYVSASHLIVTHDTVTFNTYEEGN